MRMNGCGLDFGTSNSGVCLPSAGAMRLAPLEDGTPGRCLRTVYLSSGLAAVYAFDDDILVNWKKFDAELHPLLSRIGAV